VHIDKNANPVTFKDCSIQQWTKDISWKKPNSIKQLREEKRAAKELIRAERDAAKALKALRPAGEPIPPKKPRNPKKTPKYYSKTETQAIRQSMRDLAKQYKYQSSKAESLDEAVQEFYNKSTNPLNAKILELAQQPRTNYRSHNLIVMGVRKVMV
jgi:hypothetical protein